MIPKYRAWIKEENKMIEPSDILSISFKLCEMTPNYLYGFEKEKYDFYDLELMQSTGLHDKNGKEIFEGDIVKMAKDVYSDPTYYEVIRHRSGAYRLESNQHGCELWLRHTNCEVIGNIYENPELLEVE